jgi:hypothetical protein
MYRKNKRIKIEIANMTFLVSLRLTTASGLLHTSPVSDTSPFAFILFILTNLKK